MGAGARTGLYGSYSENALFLSKSYNETECIVIMIRETFIKIMKLMALWPWVLLLGCHSKNVFL